MNIPLLTQLVHLIEEVLKSEGAAAGQAAAQAAVGTMETDPKVQAVTEASMALMAAAQKLKAAANPPPAGTK